MRWRRQEVAKSLARSTSLIYLWHGRIGKLICFKLCARGLKNNPDAKIKYTSANGLKRVSRQWLKTTSASAALQPSRSALGDDVQFLIDRERRNLNLHVFNNLHQDNHQW